jgi:uncharacterized protein YcbX
MTDSVVPDHVLAAIRAGDVALVVVFCDRCGVEHRADYTGATSQGRITAARQHLADEAGWLIRPGRDLCVDCAV